ncbi:MAG: hypothetical protein ACOH5I_19345 [Oligoflexus sp.]
MNWTTILVVPTLVISLFACDEKAKDPPYFAPEAKQSADVVPQIPYTPTNPNGGFIPGKPQMMDPEESAKRQAKNSSEPIVWGESIAGISLSTSYEDAQKILAQRLQTDGQFEVYPENIQIGWRSTVPPTPEIILAFGTYGGRLELPDPIGEVALGDNLSAHFADDPNGNNFMRLVGAHFEGKNPQNYDCRAELTCSISSFNNLLFFEFKRGSIAFDSSFRMEWVYILAEDQTFFPRLNGDVDYQATTLNGFNLNTTRAQFETTVGPPQGQNGNLFLYDDLNVVVAWNFLQMPALLAAQSDYQGNIIIPNVGDGSFNLGDSFADLVSEGDDGTELILLLDRALNNRPQPPDPPYDCLAEETCQKDVSQGTLLLNLQKGTFAFSDDAERTLRFVSLVPERTSFADP